jgi:hypothetical protein
MSWKASHDRSRKAEQARQDAQSNIFEQSKVDMVTRWEHSTMATMERNAVQKRVAARRVAYQAEVAGRRRRLAALLAADRKTLDDELRSVHETPEQRATRLMETAHALRDKREAARLKKVEYEVNRQFRAGLDEFRTADTKSRLHDVDKFRRVQMQEKIAAKAQEVRRIARRALFERAALRCWRISRIALTHARSLYLRPPSRLKWTLRPLRRGVSRSRRAPTAPIVRRRRSTPRTRRRRASWASSSWRRRRSMRSWARRSK